MIPRPAPASADGPPDQHVRARADERQRHGGRRQKPAPISSGIAGGDAQEAEADRSGAQGPGQHSGLPGAPRPC